VPPPPPPPGVFFFFLFFVQGFWPRTCRFLFLAPLAPPGPPRCIQGGGAKAGPPPPSRFPRQSTVSPISIRVRACPFPVSRPPPGGPVEKPGKKQTRPPPNFAAPAFCPPPVPARPTKLGHLPAYSPRFLSFFLAGLLGGKPKKSTGGFGPRFWPTQGKVFRPQARGGFRPFPGPRAVCFFRKSGL